MRTWAHRFYSDYLMSSRLGEYADLIEAFLESGFAFYSIIDFYNLIKTRGIDKSRKYVIIRHDIDTAPAKAGKFFEIEKKYNVLGSYYFRLSTLDYGFMKDLITYGSEASYHFEEIASFCKVHHLRSKDQVFKNIGQIREIFASNFLAIEHKVGTKLRSVASHGDFINRKLKIRNIEITKDIALRERLGIEVEAYDAIVLRHMDISISDRPFPHFWAPGDPREYAKRCRVIGLQTHPRSWGRSPVANFREDWRRFAQSLTWQPRKLRGLCPEKVVSRKGSY